MTRMDDAHGRERCTARLRDTQRGTFSRSVRAGREKVIPISEK